MQARSPFVERRTPSLRVTTAELAAVVCGREDIALPTWADDPTFEAELERLIAESSAVWICADCDSIVAFFTVDDPRREAEFLLDLLYVYRREEPRCHFCASGQLVLARPEILTTGEAVDASFMSEFEGRDLESVVPPVTSPFEGFLDSVLRAEYGALPHERTDLLEISESTAIGLANDFAQLVDDWGARESAAARIPGHIAGVKYVALRPVSVGPGVNVLGQIWEEVQRMTREEYPELRLVAVGIAKNNGLSASAHLGPGGEEAVVLAMGLFGVLYKLNHLLGLIFDGGDDDRWSADELARGLAAELCETQLDAAERRPIPSGAYGSHDDFLRTHSITRAQQQFAVCHELAHLVDWRRRDRIAYDAAGDPASRLLAGEAWADHWAMDIIMQRGSDSFPPWLQFRSIFWLFEYWNLMQAVFRDNSTIYNHARRRWDGIKLILERAQVDTSRLEIEGTRHFFDNMVDDVKTGGT